MPALGYILILGIAFAIVATVSFGLAALFSFGVIPVIYTIRKVPKERQIGCLLRGVLTIVIGIGITGILMVSFVHYSISQSKSDELDFWSNAGEFDFYRMPLDYPYELTMVDVRDKASIGIWSHASNAPSIKQDIHGIRRYLKQGPILVGEEDDSRFGGTTNRNWFWFDCVSGNGMIFTNRQEYITAIGPFGFTNEPSLKTVEENWDEFWTKESNWKR